MKRLIDTSVWSLALRRKDAGSLSPDEQKLQAELVQAIQDGQVATLGLIRQELLSGIKEKAQFDRVKAALDAYLDEPINTADLEYAARIYNECRNEGVEPGTVDLLICAVATRRSRDVLSGDCSLNRCFAVAKKFHEKQKKAVGMEEARSSRALRKS